MNKKEKLAFAVVAALAMSSGGFAVASYKDNFVSSDQVIYACVTGINGNITKVSNTPKTCPRGTTPISWNMVGPKGDQGIQGLKGDQGLLGQTGPQGKTGATSGVYLTNDSGEYVADVVSFNAQTGIATLRIDGSYWLFSQERGLMPVMQFKFKSPNWNYIAQTKYYLSSDCTGTAYYPQVLQDWDGQSPAQSLYEGVSISDITGWVPSPSVAYDSGFRTQDMKSKLVGYNWNYGDRAGCVENQKLTENREMFELKQSSSDLGLNPRIVSSHDGNQ